MSAAMVRGWCPSLHEPMAALDGLIVRVKPFVRGLSAADLHCIAGAAEEAGASGLELTARSALQVRGLDEAGAELFARAMVQAGLASAEPAVERRRNIQLGVGCGPELLGVAGALERWLIEDSSLVALPAKFGFAVSPGGGIAADIVVLGDNADCIVIGGEVALRPVARPPLSAFPGLVPGPYSATVQPPNGFQTSRHGPPEQVRGRREEVEVEVLDAVQRLTRAFLTLVPLQPTPPRRMKGLIQAIGPAAVLAEAGLITAPVNAGSSPPLRSGGGGGAADGGGVGGSSPLHHATRGSPPPLRRGGEVPQPPHKMIGPSHDGYSLGVVFGVLNPSALRTVANFATQYGDGRVLAAPGRVIWLRGVSPSDHVLLSNKASTAGFIIDPGDRRLRLDACVGRAGCARASEDVRAAALRLASAAPVTGLHVSGCAKGCAHPGAAGVTLVSRGLAGRYDLILDGAPSAPATAADVSLDEIAEYLSEPAL
jgi:precorrin-3B synthase